MLCPDCWDDDLHKDHEVLFGQTTSFSSQCDCGDTTAWLPGAPQGCRRHCGARDSGDPLPTPSCPPDLRQAIHDVLTTCIEYIISTLVFAHSPRDFGNLPNTEDEMMRWAGPTSCDVDNRAGPYAVVIYSDEKHTSVEVTRQVRDALGVQWAEAERITRELEEAVSEPLQRNDAAEQLCRAAKSSLSPRGRSQRFTPPPCSSRSTLASRYASLPM